MSAKIDKKLVVTGNNVWQQSLLDQGLCLTVTEHISEISWKSVLMNTSHPTDNVISKVHTPSWNFNMNHWENRPLH